MNLKNKIIQVRISKNFYKNIKKKIKKIDNEDIINISSLVRFLLKKWIKKNGNL